MSAFTIVNSKWWHKDLCADPATASDKKHMSILNKRTLIFTLHGWCWVITFLHFLKIFMQMPFKCKKCFYNNLLCEWNFNSWHALSFQYACQAMNNNLWQCVSGNQRLFPVCTATLSSLIFFWLMPSTLNKSMTKLAFYKQVTRLVFKEIGCCNFYHAKLQSFICGWLNP